MNNYKAKMRKLIHKDESTKVEKVVNMQDSLDNIGYRPKAAYMDEVSYLAW